MFYENNSFKIKKGKEPSVALELVPARLRGEVLTFPVKDKKGKVIVEEGRRITSRHIRQMETAKLTELVVNSDFIVGASLAQDIVDAKTGEVLYACNSEITEELIEQFFENEISEFQTIYTNDLDCGPFISDTLRYDSTTSKQEAMVEIYRMMRPGEPPTLETAEALFKSLFFDPERYDLSSVGRVKMNSRLNLETDDQMRVLRKEDILAILKVLVGLKDGRGDIDDIDHLGNRRVRSVGELLENQYRVGLLRMERAIRERMSTVEIDSVMPHDLINAKPAAAAVREFFGSSQLSQFMDQTNPLSEITHKRRLSALGPGGLTRERAGFEVRDVHPTHYGRICPIETPEGPNIGLINSLATFARVNQYGFIETPYRVVTAGKVTDEVIYMSSMD